MNEHIHRGRLPHWFVPGAAHFVTWRLAETLPIKAILRLREKKAQLLKRPAQDRSIIEHHRRIHKLLFADYDRLLDTSSTRLWLRDAAAATIIRDNLLHHDGQKYVLHAWCVMANHVHALFTPNISLPPHEAVIDDATIGETADATSPLSSVMHSLKSYTANQLNRLLNRSGQLWQHESYDHWIRDDEELERVLLYIIWNPVKAGLVNRPEQWRWSSCYDRYQIDGDTTGWLA